VSAVGLAYKVSVVILIW